MALLDLKNISFRISGPPLLDDVNLLVEKGERICLMGRNGVGKTTMLRLLAGLIKPDSGEIARQPRLRVAILAQEMPPEMTGTILDVVAGGFAQAGLPTPDADQLHLIEQTITRCKLDRNAEFATLSTGTKRRTLLARALVIEPDILLLDEPTNHLDIDAIDWLEAELGRFAGTIFFVTHDRAFLRALARRIIELDRGRLSDWKCGYDTFLQRREETLRIEESRNSEFDRKLAEEEVWLRRGILARRTRNEGRVRALLKMREERRDRREQTGSARIALQDGMRSGRQVIRTRDLDFAWDDLVMVKHFTTRIARGDKIGILGPNGSGKTTLLRLLLGELTPTGGEIEHGVNLQVAYYDQQRDQLDESLSVQENITGGSDTVYFNGKAVHIVTYLKNFLFTADQARSPISHLSGGERNRLLLARLFTKPANVLVLDEPTNDLDIETVELLEEMLVDFEGTLLLVSHDREFLDNVTTSTLVLEGAGHIAETVGGYSDWARTVKDKATPKSNSKKGKQGKPRVDSPRKLTWKERRELEALPQQIESGETEQTDLHEKLGDPSFYQEAGEQVAIVTARLEALKSELAELYVRWEELDGLES
ncbi:MAG: ATP-binding cassette domain-containing protein [bacterium]|nr:ATP-binding cassette domain-containing protein [bacterium]